MSYIVSPPPCKTLVIALIGLSILFASIVPYAALAQTMSVPSSMDELLDKVTLVVIGELGPPARCYDAPSQMSVDCKNPNGPAITGPMVYTLQLIVKEVLLDDGSVAAETPIVILGPGLPLEVEPDIRKDMNYPPSLVGDRHLFLLVGDDFALADGEPIYYPAFGPYGRLNIDGESLYISSGTPRPFQITYDDDPITLEELKQILADRQPERQDVAPLYFPFLRGSSATQGTDSTDAQSFFDTVVRTAVAVWQQYTNYLQESRANQG